MSFSRFPPVVAAGNIAAEDFEFRHTLIANGVVRPLAQLLVQAAKVLDNRAGGRARDVLAINR